MRCDALQERQRFGRRNRVHRERGVGGDPDKPELGQWAGCPTRRGFPGEPFKRRVVMDVRRPRQGKKEIEIKQENQDSSSNLLTRSRVITVLSGDVSNTGNPQCSRPTGRVGRNPRRAKFDSAAPIERFLSSAIDRATSRISSSMFSVVLMRENYQSDAMMSRCIDAGRSCRSSRLPQMAPGQCRQMLLRARHLRSRAHPKAATSHAGFHLVAHHDHELYSVVAPGQALSLVSLRSWDRWPARLRVWTTNGQTCRGDYRERSCGPSVSTCPWSPVIVSSQARHPSTSGNAIPCSATKFDCLASSWTSSWTVVVHIRLA